MKRLHKFLKIFIFVQLGACAYRVFALYNDYLRHTDLYTTYSAPWYTDIIITIVITGIMVLLTWIACFVVGRVIKKRDESSEK